ncbi:hypothetical protein OHA72_62795 [Dactylosporangium sp. NBC_01737]|uniref:hypothetical protein n=1 Tax=Dactylosporangium sp. NBC_01737 TaxID=2975959 RepID=UPI002E162B0D|nr:hypothetical protein OHA72_62795 [Dactylosporangium sp. NBC_01737]
MSTPPLTIAEAADRNPFQLLLDLYNHTRRRKPAGEPAEAALEELALAAAVVSWWSRWQPLTMHRAFESGASLGEVASATGLTEEEVYVRWSRWADVQCALILGGCPAVDPAIAADIRTRLRPSSRDAR